MMETTQKVIELTAKHLELPLSSLKAEDDLFETLSLDSFQALGLLTALEKEFGIEIPDHELQGVTTLAKISEIIHKKL